MKCGSTSVGGSRAFVTNAWADDLRVLRAIAGSRLRTEWLQRWWCQKFNRPRKDPLLNDYTLEELMIEYLEDVIETNPQEEFPQSVQASGLFVHRTGDALVDKWQEKSALGDAIDFSEAFTTDETKKEFEAIKARSKKKFQERNPATAKADEPMPGDIHDDYTGKR